MLAIIADFTGLNLVASDSVTGRVTLNLQDVPWDQALDLVLKSHGLASRQEGNVIVVAPAGELADIERQQIEARAQMEVLAPLTTEYVQVRYAKADDLARLLRGAEGFGLLSERGRVAVDQRTNTLLIQDTADQIQEILRTLDRLDVAVRQEHARRRFPSAMKLGVFVDGPRSPFSASEMELSIKYANVEVAPPGVVFVKLAAVAERIGIDIDVAEIVDHDQ